MEILRHLLRVLVARRSRIAVRVQNVQRRNGAEELETLEDGEFILRPRDRTGRLSRADLFDATVDDLETLLDLGRRTTLRFRQKLALKRRRVDTLSCCFCS